MPAIIPSGSTPQQPQTPPTPGPVGFQSPEQTNQVPNVPIQQIADNTIAHPGQSVADFINDAHAAGYGSIDPNIIATVAYHNGNTAQSKLALAVIKQAQAMPNKTAQYLYEQSAVNPVQSLGKVIHDHLQNTGIQPVNAEPTSQLQQQIINAGYAFPGAKADGVWNADWNNASYNWGIGQQNKLGVGGFSAQGVLNTTMGEGWLNHAIALVRGVAEAIPAGVIKGLASGLKGTSDVMTGIGSLLGNKTTMDAAQQDVLGIAHAMDSIGRITDNEKKIGTQAYIDTPFGTQDLMNIANAALSISAAGTLRKLGVSTLAGVKEGIAAGTEAGAKNAATALVKDIGPQAPKGILNTIMNTAFPETATGNRLAFTRWLHNVPAAQGLVNGLDKVAEGTMNTYKTARSIAATPYRLPIVGIAGKLATDASVAGMKLGIQGHTENWLGDPNAPQAFALDHLTPIAGLAAQALNTLQLGAHGPSYDSAGLPSQQIADVAQSVHENFADAANSTGVLSGFERGANASVLKQMDELAKAGLNPDLRIKQISSKFMDLAARHAAQSETEDKVQAGIIDPTNADQMLRFRQNAQSVIRNDPAKLKDAIKSYWAKPMAWETDLQKEISLSKEDPTAWMNQGNVSYTKAQELFKSQLLHRLGDLQTPETGVAPEDTSWMSQGLNDVPAEPISAPSEPTSAWEGGPTLYHGTSVEHGVKSFKGFDSQSLYGQGLYTTDSRNIAEKYMKKGDGDSPTLYTAKWNKPNPPKLINLESNNPTFKKTIQDFLNGYVKNYHPFGDTNGKWDLTETRKVLKDPSSTGADVLDALTADSNKAGFPSAGVFNNLQRILQKQGFDGYTHTGGKIFKNEPHNVHIFFQDFNGPLDKANVPVDLNKVNDAPSEPAYEGGTPLFHGASTNMEGKIDDNVFRESDRNLFGDGFYTTDSRSVAKGYTKKGGNTEPTVHSVKWNGKGTPKLINLEEVASPELRKIFSSLNTEDGYTDYSTLDAALQDPKSKGTDLYRALRTDLRNNGSGDQAAEDFQHITAQLQDAGYDAMTHKGNIRGKGSDHNVTIWLKPGDLSVTKLNDAPAGVMTPAQVIASAKEAQSPIAQNQLIQIQKLMKTNGITERDARLKFMTNFLQRDVKSTNDLTNGEAGRLIKKLTPVTHSMNDARVASLKNEPISSKFGISHKDALLAQDVQRKAMGYAQELQDAKPGYIAPATLDELEQSSNGMEFGADSKPAQLPQTFNPDTATTAENTLRGKVMETLKNELGRSPQDLDYVPTQDLIKLVSEHSHWLASEVGVPAELQHVADALDKLGYKLNYGTDVGLQWTDPLLPKEILGSPRNLVQKGIDRIGLNLAKVEPKYLAQAKTTAAQTEMQKTIDKIKQENNTLPDWATGSRLMMAAQDIIRPSVGPLSSFYLDMAAAPVVGKAVTLRPALGSAWGDEIKALMHTTQTNLDGTTTTIETRRDALSFIEKKLAASNTPQTWLKKDWMKAMTSKGDDRGMITNNRGFEIHAIGMSEKEANQLWFAMHKGFDKTPAYIAGINPFSKLANSTFGLANIPLEINGNRILDLTRKLQLALIQARYSVSPLQSWLRVAKSAIKGVNENMPLSANPYASLAELGANVEKAAYDLTDKVYGVDKNANDVAAEFSAAEFAGHKDLSNVFNPRATLARTVHYVAQNMMNEKYAEAALNPFPDKLKLKIETPKEGVVETKPIYDQFDKKTEIKTQSNDNYKVSFANKETGNEAARILWNKDTGEIKSVFVDPAFRRQGLAKSLFANATKIANEKGIQEPVHSTLLSEEGNAWKKALDQSELHGITPADYPELKSRVDAINNYGNRTAAEKSVNAFFFPFSFEKTVVRELGGALLDSPSLRMMAAGAVAAYNSTDGQTTKKWMEDNLPLFKEAEKFNPFYHGTGLGQFGGINKTPFSVAEHLLYGGKPTPKNPLDGLTAADKLELFVKMLMPKPVTTKNSAVAALALVPALKDLSTNILGYNPGSSGPQGLSQSALMTTYHTLKWEAGSEISKIVKDHRFTGLSNTDNWASQGHLPYQVQQNQAWQLRSQIISAYSSALAANQHGGNFAFPEGFPPAFAGTQRITTGNINQLVHEVYPAFDPAKIYTSIGAKLTAVADQRAEILQKSPDLIDYYNQFIKYSDEVQGFIAKDSLLPTFDSSKLVEPMNYLRNLAATLSANDPTFPAFYSKYYATKYGALKGL